MPHPISICKFIIVVIAEFLGCPKMRNFSVKSKMLFSDVRLQ